MKKILDKIPSVLLIINWIITFYYYNELPEKIPAHFNLKGEVDRWGEKIEMFFIPAIHTVIYFLLNYLTKIPQHHKYPVKVNEQNKEKLHGLSIRLLKFVILMTGLIFLTITIISIKVALAHKSFTTSIILIEIAILFLGIFYYISNMFEKSN
jgi:uncharacterized membrane protein